MSYPDSVNHASRFANCLIRFGDRNENPLGTFLTLYYTYGLLTLSDGVFTQVGEALKEIENLRANLVKAPCLSAASCDWQPSVVSIGYHVCPANGSIPKDWHQVVDGTQFCLIIFHTHFLGTVLYLYANWIPIKFSAFHPYSPRRTVRGSSAPRGRISTLRKSNWSSWRRRKPPQINWQRFLYCSETYSFAFQFSSSPSRLFRLLRMTFNLALHLDCGRRQSRSSRTRRRLWTWQKSRSRASRWRSRLGSSSRLLSACACSPPLRYSFSSRWTIFTTSTTYHIIRKWCCALSCVCVCVCVCFFVPDMWLW